MTNESIRAAFERMWQHIMVKLSGKADLSHNHNDIYYTESEIDEKVDELSASIDGVIDGNITVKNADSATTADSLTGVTATTTELNYVDGVTSNIQTQLNSKAPTSHESTSTTYGIGSPTHYGHVKISNDYDKYVGDAATGVAASQAT